ncbi:oxidoreductase, partial [Mesorhizobium sp. M00.F.Ca.ET.186.01.1.1]
IASAPEAGAGIELAIERLDDGEVSPFFHDVAEIGDEIELRGPLGGHFIWEASDGGPILLVGGGSGVVPLMAMVRHRALQKSAAPIALVFSARVWDEVIFRDELIGLDGRRDGFDLALTLTREQARRPSDYSRRVDARMMMQA